MNPFFIEDLIYSLGGPEEKPDIEQLLKKPDLKTIFWQATRRNDWPHQDRASGDSSLPEKELTAEEVKQIFKEIALDFNAKEIKVEIMGGEPLLREDLAELVSGIKKLGFYVFLTTNGFRLGKDPGLISELVRAGIDGFTIILDVMEKDQFFPGGKNTPLSALEGIKYLHSHFPEVEVNASSLISDENFDDIDLFFQLLQKYQVTTWFIKTTDSGQKEIPAKGCILNNEKFQKLLTWIQHQRNEFRFGLLNTEVEFAEEDWCGIQYENKIRSCYAFSPWGIFQATLYSDGLVGGSPYSRAEFQIQGDAKKERFSSLWKDRFQPFRDRQWLKQDDCVPCPEWANCFGGALDKREGSGKKKFPCSFSCLARSST
jgi:MoaA/NifB/PqqE/SkfB family radical SAM enzyme